MSHTLFSSVLFTAACVLVAPAVSAQSLRVHGTAGAAKPVTGYQRTEFSFGGNGTAGVELPLGRVLGLSLDAGYLGLAAGDPPRDPTLATQDGTSLTHAELGLRWRPFGGKSDPRRVSASGFWMHAAGGVGQTGGSARLLVEGYVGFDTYYGQGRYGIGPMGGLIHVFQPNTALRPEDANVAILGLHMVWDGHRTVEPERDTDHDGLLDSRDRCPKEPEDFDGFEDTDGCPDLDNDKDGIPDAKDSCPNHAEDFDGFQDEDGCPELDNDGDRIPDAADKCPNDPEDWDGFDDEDGCPDLDNDQDGIPDAQDLCPDEPETVNGYADSDGCPDSDQVRVVGDKIVLDERIHFMVNSAVIRQESHGLLGRLTQLLKEHPEYIHIEVQGHTDERGPEWYNEKLSQARADSVMKFLVDHGIAADRLTAVGFGSSRPLTDKTNERALFLNRRVEFAVTRQAKHPVGRPPAPGGAEPPVVPPNSAPSAPPQAAPSPDTETSTPPVDPAPPAASE